MVATPAARGKSYVLVIGALRRQGFVTKYNALQFSLGALRAGPLKQRIAELHSATELPTIR